MIAAVYVRVSTQDQAEHGFSLDDQEERCVARAHSLGAEEVLVFADPGESGAELNRPGLTKLRNALQAGGLGLVVILDPDRLARNLVHQLLVTEEIERAGARLEFLNFEWRNTPEGRLFYSLRGAVAEYEKEKIRERTLRGREAAARRGRIIASGGWYGYMRDPDSGEWKPDPATASFVADIFHMAAEQRLTPSIIATVLVRRGVPSARGGYWAGKQVRRILTNPVYKGLVYNFRSRHKFPDSSGWEAALEHADDVSVVAVTPIVDEALWNAARATVAAKPPGRGRSTAKTPYLLSGLVLCGACGSHMSPGSTFTDGKRYRYYKCNSQDGARKAIPKDRRCKQRRVRADDLEAIAWRETLAVLNHPARVLEIVADSGASAREREASRLREKLAWWNARRARTLEAFTMGWMRQDEVDGALRKCGEEIGALQASLAALETQSVVTSRDVASNIEVFCRGLLDAADSADVATRSRLVRMLLDRVVVEGKAVRLVGRFDAGATGSETRVPFAVEAVLA